MTATLDRPDLEATEPEPPTWRDRLQPLVPASGGWGVTLVVTVIAGLLRFLRLDQPASALVKDGPDHGQIFDELYYACDAKSLMQYGVEHHSNRFCDLDAAPAFVVHPPLGKWLIGLGEQLLGFNSWGWRIAAALFGTLTVLLVVRIGRRMTGSSLLGGLAGLLLAVDGLHFVQSRVAMVDVFLCFWIVAAFGCLVVDRDVIRSRLATSDEEQLASGAVLGRRWWRVLAGVCLGAALATKWSALFPAVVLVVLSVFWEVGARRTAGVRAPWRTTLRRTTAPLLATLVLLPVAVYVVSWTGWFLSDDGWDRTWAQTRGTSWPMIPEVMRSWWHYHWEIYNFHNTLDAPHPYQSHPLSWPFLGRPVSYYYPSGIGQGVYDCVSPPCSREVLAVGTPALWWMWLPVTFGLIARWVSRRDWRAAALVLMTSVSVLAWLPSDAKGRTMFLFYALPSVPFLCLGVALVAGWLLGRAGTLQRTVSAAGIGVYTSAVVVNFVWLYPVLAAQTLRYSEWYHRMWFRSWI